MEIRPRLAGYVILGSYFRVSDVTTLPRDVGYMLSYKIVRCGDVPLVAPFYLKPSNVMLVKCRKQNSAGRVNLVALDVMMDCDQTLGCATWSAP